MVNIVASTNLIARFWPKVDKRHPDECWPWKAATTFGGYGVLGEGGRRGKIVRASRLSYIIHKGEIPDGFVVRHACDNSACVNPDHLLIGTQADNIRDAVARGRQGHPPKKLSDDDVKMVRNGQKGVRKLARELGVSSTLISLIRTGKRRVKG